MLLTFTLNTCWNVTNKITTFYNQTFTYKVCLHWWNGNITNINSLNELYITLQCHRQCVDVFKGQHYLIFEKIQMFKTDVFIFIMQSQVISAYVSRIFSKRLHEDWKSALYGLR